MQDALVEHHGAHHAHFNIAMKVPSTRVGLSIWYKFDHWHYKGLSSCMRLFQE